VYGTFVKMSKPKENADHYLEIGFYDKAGSLKPGESVELKVGFAKNGWTKYNQFNDYSYNRVNNRFINWIILRFICPESWYTERNRKTSSCTGQGKPAFRKNLYGALYFKCGGFAPHLKQKKE